MVSCLRIPMAYTIPSSASCSCSCSSSQSVRRLKTLKLSCGALGAKAAAKIPMPPVNPNDPFLKRLAFVAASSPEKIRNRTGNTDMPPYVDLFEPQLMATSSELARSATYNEHRARTPPPDLPSILLDARIVYIGMPFVSLVTELIVSEIMYLNWLDPKLPIYLYINSTGTTRDDGETVAMETEGFAIYDALMMAENEICTLCLGAAMGQACLLLAAGNKGKRYMFPNATAVIQQPRLSPSGLMSATDALIHADEIKLNKDLLMALLARHTGNSYETIANVMKAGPFYMDSAKAKEFGVIDKVLWRGQEYLMENIDSSEEFDKRAGIKAMDDF